MASPQGARKRGTYRLTPELDRIITEQATRQGISKNAFVQRTLYELLVEKREQKPTGTDS